MGFFDSKWVDDMISAILFAGIVIGIVLCGIVWGFIVLAHHIGIYWH